jgi:DNA-directed RNA polymerase I subunit RPA2
VAADLLADYVFIHIDPSRPADKFGLLLHMLHKLYALVGMVHFQHNTA